MGRCHTLPQGCDETHAFAFDKAPLGGTITLAGCGQWPLTLPDVLQYNVAGKKWSNVGCLLEARRNQAGVNIGSATKPKLMVLGGYSGDGSAVLDTSEIGTPAAVPGAAPRIGAHSTPAKGWASAF